MADSTLSDAERRFLEALNERGVRYLVVGMGAALLQGARGATEDIDLWFEDPGDPRIAEAAQEAGGFWVSGSFGMRPPALGGDELSDRFDVVVHMHGLRDFATEYAGAGRYDIDGVPPHDDTSLDVRPGRAIVAPLEAVGTPRSAGTLLIWLRGKRHPSHRIATFQKRGPASRAGRGRAHAVPGKPSGGRRFRDAHALNTREKTRNDEQAICRWSQLGHA